MLYWKKRVSVFSVFVFGLLAGACCTGSGNVENGKGKRVKNSSGKGGERNVVHKGVGDEGKNEEGKIGGLEGVKGDDDGSGKTVEGQKLEVDQPRVMTPPDPGAMAKLLGKVDAKLSSQSNRYAGYRSYGRYGSRMRPAKKSARDQSLAPYFHVPGSGKQGIEELPLKKTSAEVNIAGVIAQAKVTQVYKNEGKKPIEAVYVFPASTKAAVHGMRMKIGDRIIEARIEKREQARKIYEKAKEEGKRASLLEQERSNVFTMNVANIMPGDEIEVELDYSELLVPEDQVYEFVYPTVVGPRFTGGADPKSDKWMKNPHTKAGKKESYEFDIKVHVESPIGIKELSSPSHPVKVDFASRTAADVTLKKSGGGNRDYILKYKLAGDSIETGMMAFEGEKEKFFLLMMEPPKRVKKKDIPPREYVFVVDVSGSMSGFPLNVSKELIRNLFKGMSSKDYFNVVLFAASSRVLSPKSLRATKGNLEKVLNIMGFQRGGGGTQLLEGLKTAYALPKVKSKGVSRSVVVITDGYVGVEKQTFRFIDKNLNSANLFSFGIGRSVNRALIEDMGRAGMGESFVVTDDSEGAETAAKFRKYIEAPVLTDINVSYNGIKVSDVVPRKFPDLMAQRPLIAFGKYTGRPTGKVTVSGASGNGTFKREMTFGPDAVKPANKPLRVLWARKWVAKLSDQLTLLPKDSDLEEAITNVGLTYNMMTQFTSFVAVGLKQVRKDGKVVTVRQPLPMPKGVSNLAIGKGGTLDDSMSGYSGGGVLRRGVSRSARRRVSPRKSFAPAPSSSGDPLSSLLGGSTPAEREEKSKAEPTKKAGGEAEVSVLGVRNIISKHRQRVTRYLNSRLSRTGGTIGCLSDESKSGKFVQVIVRTDLDGKISITGLKGKHAACLKRSLKNIFRLLSKQKSAILQDSSKPVVIRIRVRWK